MGDLAGRPPGLPSQAAGPGSRGLRQELGRLPWLAAFFLRAFFLRARFAIVGLLSFLLAEFGCLSCRLSRRGLILRFPSEMDQVYPD